MDEAPSSSALGRQSALAEAAYGLYRMIQPECSVEELRACLKFRKAVAEEFERLLRAGAEGTDLPEVDDGELDPVEQGSAAGVVMSTEARKWNPGGNGLAVRFRRSESWCRVIERTTRLHP